MTSVILRLVRSGGGESAVASLLEQAGSKHEPSYLESAENWVSLDEACALLAAGVQLTGDPSFARRVGEQTLKQHSGTQVATLLRSLGSLEAVLAAVTQTAAKVSTVTDMEAVEVGPGRAVVRASAREGFTRPRLHCEWASGMLAGTPDPDSGAIGGGDVSTAVVMLSPCRTHSPRPSRIGVVSYRPRLKPPGCDLIATSHVISFIGQLSPKY